MLRKTLITLVALMMLLVTDVFAVPGGPNPGWRNPGSTLWADGYTGKISDFRPLQGDRCYDTSFCGLAEADAYDSCIENGDDVVTCAADAVAWGALACRAGSWAAAAWTGSIDYKGKYEIWRHGNNGSVHEIWFKGGLSAAVLNMYARSGTASETEAFAGGGEQSRGMVWAGADSFTEVCGTIEPEEAGDDFAEFCASALAKAQAGAEASAEAQAFGYSGAEAMLSASTEANHWNRVVGANIEQYHAAVTGAMRAFVETEADAMTNSLAAIFLDAFAAVRTEVCVEADVAGDWVGFDQVCEEGDAEALAHAEAFAETWALAQASALARMQVEVTVSLLYANVPGTEDWLFFDHGWAGQSFASASCSSEASPEPEPAP